jgi:hypothetical protein
MQLFKDSIDVCPFSEGVEKERYGDALGGPEAHVAYGRCPPRFFPGVEMKKSLLPVALVLSSN